MPNNAAAENNLVERRVPNGARRVLSLALFLFVLKLESTATPTQRKPHEPCKTLEEVLCISLALSDATSCSPGQREHSTFMNSG